MTKKCPTVNSPHPWWFKHFYNASREAAIFKMRVKLGNEGLGVYWLLIEWLHENNGYLENEAVSLVSKQLDYVEEKLLSLLREFGLFEYDEKGYYRLDIIKHLSDVAALIKVRKESSRKGVAARKAKYPKGLPNADQAVNQMIDQTVNQKPNQIRLDKDKNNILTPYGVSSTAVAAVVSYTHLDFENVWGLYERKGSRKLSERKWKQLSTSNREKALKNIPLYVAATPEKQYRKNFETYLGQEAWNDELPPVRGCTGPKAVPTILPPVAPARKQASEIEDY
jgi:hypothetical protein